MHESTVLKGVKSGEKKYKLLKKKSFEDDEITQINFQ